MEKIERYTGDKKSCRKCGRRFVRGSAVFVETQTNTVFCYNLACFAGWVVENDRTVAAEMMVMVD